MKPRRYRVCRVSCVCLRCHSSTSVGRCIEIAPDFPAVVPVRDSKNPDGPVLVVTRSAWAAFTSGL
ncbi:DUF397 domain-containing protein [Streptomyces sp. NPDC054940]